MKRHYLALLTVLSVVFWCEPSQAEMTAEAVAEQIRATNVQRLILTNECYRCDLVGVDLSGTHLIGADLREAALAGANLSWSNLEGADLTEANLTGANLTGAFLTNTSFAYATLDNADFSQAQLYYVNVTGASMENLNLANAAVVGTPISVGGADPVKELPVLSPNENRRLTPPGSPWLEPWESPGEFLDVPPQVLPQV